ncbi:MAG: M20/M25/M40 family metallo-hydrolase, partial [Pseudomonadota bacterium]
MTLDATLQTLDDTRAQAIERLFALLRIPSISTDPAYSKACHDAAQWLADDLASMGFEASVRPTPGQPMVVAHHDGPGGDAPHILFYGHYDVQPADPLELWETGPFEPRLTETAIVARGAVDDKGQLMTFLEAARAHIANGGLPCRVTVLLEGEEESGSPSLEGFLEATADELKADVALVCDTEMWDRTTPAITTRLRGMAATQVTIRAASHDLHSGMFGGPGRNPIHLLTRILADLHDGEGRVTLPGFYDGVPELDAETRASWEATGFDEAAFLSEIGLSVPAGETDRTVLEKVWSRPTAEVNGIWGGYTGAGFKTVIPSEAHAKISFRLVGTQDPQAVLDALHAHIDARLPKDCEASYIEKNGSPAITIGRSDALEAAQAALEEEWGTPPVMAGCGGSIPIVGAFKDRLGMESLLIGFAQGDDRMHSPNEKYELTSFHKGA